MKRFLLLPVILVALAAPIEVFACGMPLGARIPSEQALVVFDGKREQITTSLGLQVDKADAAVIFPVPATPEVDQPAGSDQLFSYLENATRPTVRQERQVVWRINEGGAMAGAPPGTGVYLIGREIIGGYDVARLATDDTSALGRWLAENGYKVPPWNQRVLDSYITDGWKFVAVKLASQTAGSTGSLAPLRISFPSDRLVYPMRLAQLSPSTLDLQLYLISDHRLEQQPLMTLFAGPVAALDPAPNPQIAALMAGAPYLTKLRHYALSAISDDFVPTRSATDEPFRDVQVVVTHVSALDVYALPFILGCGVSLLAVTVASVIWLLLRRIGKQGTQ